MIKQLSDQKNLFRKLHLLQTAQTVTLVGSFELDIAEQESLWTDAMFVLHGLAVPTNNTISLHAWMQLVHPEDQLRVRHMLLHETHQELTEFNFEIITVTSEVKHLHAWFWLLENEEGMLVKRGSVQDVTRQRKLENELHAANEELLIKAEITEHAETIANSGSYTWNLTTGSMQYSDNLYRIFGFEPGAITPSFEFFNTLVHPEDKERLFSNKERLSGKTHNTTLNYRIVLANGQVRYIHSRSRKLLNKKNEEIIVGSIRDITEERLTVLELEKRTLLSESISENNVDMVSAFDKDLRFIWWNKKCEDRYGLKREEVLGKHPFEVFPHLKGSAIDLSLHAALQGETVHLEEEEFSNGNGYFESFVIPLFQDEKVFGILVIMHDLSEIKQVAQTLDALNKSLELKNQELEKSNNELISFSYVASHDLQEPLRKIRTFSERLLEKEEGNLSATGKDYLKRMDNASIRMQTLIEDLLAFSRTTTIPKSFETLELNKLLDEVQVNLKDSIDANKAIIIADPLPTAMVIKFQFQQLLENLLINALKYRKATEPPNIKISYQHVLAANVPFTPANGINAYHLISVKDNGIGFEQEYAEKIFEIFQRLHGKHEYSGTGIGLAICKKTMENHNGYISAEGVPGVGATFHVFLPDNQN